MKKSCFFKILQESGNKIKQYKIFAHCKNGSAVPTPFVVSSLCECDTWCSPSTPGCHTSTLGCHLMISTLGCHCSTHGVTLAPPGCHHSTKTWCHIRTHVILTVHAWISCKTDKRKDSCKFKKLAWIWKRFFANLSLLNHQS